MRAATLFSGIGAPECAAPWIDWCWSAEIDPFAAAVHAARFPGVPNLGDVNRIDPDAVEPVDLVVFGSPCQSFSIAGKRLGLDDPRGNLALVALRLVEHLRPRWFVFENVPGLLSSDGGRDFGAFLGTVEQCGYGWAYRTLDAQFAGVPQRRRRVFVVGCLGDWRGPAAVLFESESLRGDPPPRREAGQRIARPIMGGTNGDERRPGAQPDDADNLIVFSAKDHGGDAGDTAPTLRAGQHHNSHANAGVMPAVAYGGNNRSGPIDVASAFNGHGRLDFTVETFIAHSLRGDSFAAGEDGTSLKVGGGKPGQGYPAAITGMSVRRLTPRECERLQGFPDDFTAITYRGKPAADGPRYRALGNSMAVPVIGWVLGRIREVAA